MILKSFVKEKCNKNNKIRIKKREIFADKRQKRCEMIKKIGIGKNMCIHIEKQETKKERREGLIYHETLKVFKSESQVKFPQAMFYFSSIRKFEEFCAVKIKVDVLSHWTFREVRSIYRISTFFVINRICYIHKNFIP